MLLRQQNGTGSFDRPEEENDENDMTDEEARETAERRYVSLVTIHRHQMAGRKPCSDWQLCIQIRGETTQKHCKKKYLIDWLYFIIYFLMIIFLCIFFELFSTISEMSNECCICMDKKNVEEHTALPCCGQLLHNIVS